MSMHQSQHSLQSDISSAAPPRAMWAYMSISAILAVALACELSLLVAYGPPGSSSWSSESTVYLLPACLAGLLAGWFFWWLFIVKPRSATVVRGVLLGALSSFLAHPLIWLLLWPFTQHVWTMERLFFDIGYETMISLIEVGWITALVGGATGGLLLSYQRALTRRFLVTLIVPLSLLS
ncbi:MAG TPA: hypothetical protein VFV38_25135 [Ktedonobacteraceae bacterium]|nr:hypothetical protein [Ktedonobacteraceae bacterium]